MSESGYVTGWTCQNCGQYVPHSSSWQHVCNVQPTPHAELVAVLVGIENRLAHIDGLLVGLVDELVRTP